MDLVDAELARWQWPQSYVNYRSLVAATEKSDPGESATPPDSLRPLEYPRCPGKSSKSFMRTDLPRVVHRGPGPRRSDTSMETLDRKPEVFYLLTYDNSWVVACSIVSQHLLEIIISKDDN